MIVLASLALLEFSPVFCMGMVDVMLESVSVRDQRFYKQEIKEYEGRAWEMGHGTC